MLFHFFQQPEPCLHPTSGPLRYREEGKCSHCGSYNRLRQLADIILPEASRLTGRKLQVRHSQMRCQHTSREGQGPEPKDTS